MSAKIKQRIVGTFVLLLIGLTIIPLFIRSHAPEPESHVVNIPKPPQALNLNLIEENEQRRQNLIDQYEESKSEPKVAGWIIQLASFTKAENANNLIKRLRSEGFSAYSQVIEYQQSKHIRIFVGPELSKTNAIRLQEKLKEQFQLDGLLIQYDPTEQ